MQGLTSLCVTLPLTFLHIESQAMKNNKKYRKTEITALTNQRRINNWLIAATLLAALMPFVVQYLSI